MKSKYSKMVALAFVVALTGFLVLCIATPDETFSEQENRNLKAFPELSAEAIIDGSFMEEFETYSSDTVVGRDLWVKIKNLADKSLGKKDNGNAYWGAEGFIFPAEYINPVQLEKNLTYIYEFVARAKERGLEKASIMAVPTSQEILKEYVPEHVQTADEQMVLDMVEDKLADGLEVIQVADTLKANKDSKYIYYLTDHHWTQLGAYYGYRVWAEENGFEPLDPKDIQMVKAADEFYGTTYSKIATFNMQADVMYVYKTPRMNEMTLEVDGKIMDMFDEHYLETKDKYSYFLSSNHPLAHLYRVKGGPEAVREALDKSAEAKEEMVAKATEGEKTLLIIKDSYANCFIPFVTEHYNNIYVVDLRYYKQSVLDLIEEKGVDEVLFLYNAIQLSNDMNLVFLKAQ